VHEEEQDHARQPERLTVLPLRYSHAVLLGKASSSPISRTTPGPERFHRCQLNTDTGLPLSCVRSDYRVDTGGMDERGPARRRTQDERLLSGPTVRVAFRETDT